MVESYRGHFWPGVYRSFAEIKLVGNLLYLMTMKQLGDN